MELLFRRIRPEAPLPSYAYAGDAALDLTSMIDVEIAPGSRAMVPTGVAVAIPEGYAGLVLPRSGLAARVGLTLANTPGLIDSGYRGEVTCALSNTDHVRSVRVQKGDRVAQLLVVPVAAVQPVWAEALPDSERGDGGFGSSGR